MSGSVLLLEDDGDVLEILALFLEIRSGRTCVCARSFAELVAKEQDALATDLAILDVNLGAGQPSGIDAYLWLRERSYRGRVAFLTGHAKSHPLVQRALALDGVALLEKPVASDRLGQVIEGAA